MSNSSGFSWAYKSYTVSVFNTNSSEQFFFKMAISNAGSSGDYEATFVARQSFYRVYIDASTNFNNRQTESASSIIPDTMPMMGSNG